MNIFPYVPKSKIKEVIWFKKKIHQNNTDRKRIFVAIKKFHHKAVRLCDVNKAIWTDPAAPHFLDEFKQDYNLLLKFEENLLEEIGKQILMINQDIATNPHKIKKSKELEKIRIEIKEDNKIRLILNIYLSNFEKLIWRARNIERHLLKYNNRLKAFNIKYIFQEYIDLLGLLKRELEKDMKLEKIEYKYIPYIHIDY